MLLGDGQVGKTSLILRLTGNEFNDSQLTTVGKESYIHQVNLHGYDLKMKIWDTAGQERFKSMSVQVIKTSDAVILVYTVNDKKSFNSLDMWLNKLSDTTDLSKKPIIIIGNKCDIDQSKRQISFEEGKQYAESKGYHFYETSAKTGENVEKSVLFLVKKIMNVRTGMKEQENNNIKLGDSSNNNGEEKKCAC